MHVCAGPEARGTGLRPPGRDPRSLVSGKNAGSNFFVLHNYVFRLRVPIRPHCVVHEYTCRAKYMVLVLSKGRGSTGTCGFDVCVACSVRARSSCGVGRSFLGRGCTVAAMCQTSFCPAPVACVASFRYRGTVVTHCRGNDPAVSCPLRARVLPVAIAVACLFAG